MKRLSVLLAAAWLSACGVDTASSAATAAALKKQELEQGRQQIEQVRQQLDQANQQVAQRAAQAAEADK
jgi:outer membrane lipopolysaccharide assembly protein LptE/RlpB